MVRSHLPGWLLRLPSLVLMAQALVSPFPAIALQYGFQTAFGEYPIGIAFIHKG